MSAKPSIEEWFRLIAMVRDGEPLPAQAREFVADLLAMVQRGEDPREFAGTMPGDPRKDPRAIVGQHYWLLRAKYGRGGEIAASQDVAEVHGLSASRVRTIGRNCKVLRDGAFKAKELGCADQIIDAIVSASKKDREVG